MRPVPGGFLLAPLPMLGAALIAFNVFWLRRHHPGALSGKLSDLGINILLPMVIAAAWDWLRFALSWLRGHAFVPAGRLQFIVAALISATYFTLLKTWPPFTEFHGTLVGLVSFGRVGARNVVDPTDLVTLLGTGFALCFALRRERQPRVILKNY